MIKQKKKAVHLEEDITSIKDSIDNKIFIHEIIEKLSNDEKIIFDLYYVKGYKTKEIASMLNKGVANIKIKLYRIRKKLREGELDV